MYLDDHALAALALALDDEEPALFVPPGLYHDPTIAHMLLDVHRCTRPSTPRMERQARWTAALGALFERYGRPKPNIEPSAFAARALNLAREYVAAHFREDVSIEDLSRLCGVSRYHFMRSFRATFGIPPHAYLNQVRLNAARRELAAGRSVSAAAAEAGFYDQSALTKMFKRSFGITPGEYGRLARR